MAKQEKVILVVEDERPLLEAIKTKLEISGFDVVTARSVQQALNHLKDIAKVDAIWLDHYLLGRESGLDFVAKCKEDGSLSKHVPIFVISNTASADKIQAYLKLGVNKYYVKAEKRLDAIIAEIKKELSKKNEE